MRTIHLYGGLTKFSTKPMEADVGDMFDVCSAMKSWFPEFQKFLHDYPEYNVVVTRKNKEQPLAISSEFFGAKFGPEVEEVHLFPKVEGEEPISSAIIVAVGATGAAAVAITIAVNLAVSLAIGAVMGALAPKPKMGQSEKPAEQPSFLFNGPENVQEQGYMVPLVYGTHMTGSIVVSAGISVHHVNIEPVVVGNTTNPNTEIDQWDGNPGRDDAIIDNGGG